MLVLSIPTLPLLEYRPLRPARPLCRHCGLYLVTRPRGLCRRCHADRRIRRRYPSTSPHGRRQPRWMSRCALRPLPPHPTDAPPGSPEKMAVMRARIAKGLSPFHPQDRCRDPEAEAARCGLGR